jgi:RNA polymerase sigma factor (sigma-70 family)
MSAWQIKEKTWNDFLAGSHKAFQSIYVSQEGFIRFIARQFRLPEEQVDDVIQEVFLKLYKRRGTIQGPSKVKAWLATCTRNHIFDGMRKKKGKEAMEFHEDLHAAPEGANDHIKRKIDWQLAEEFILKIKDEKGMDSFRSFYLDGKTAQEIASHKGEAVSTVTTRISRLRRKLADEMKLYIQNNRGRQS